MTDFLVKREDIRECRGAFEHVYAGTQRAVFGEDDWETLPETVKDDLAGAALLDFVEISARAIEAGSFKRRSDLVFTWDEFAAF